MPGKLITTQNAYNSPQTTRAGTSTGSLPPAAPPPSGSIPSSPPIPIPHGRRSARAHDPTWAAAAADDYVDQRRHSESGDMGVTYAGNVFPMTYGAPQPMASTTAAAPPDGGAPQRVATARRTIPNDIGTTHAPTLDSIPSQPSTPPAATPADSLAAVFFPTPIRSGWSLDITNGRTPQNAATTPSVLPPAVPHYGNRVDTLIVAQGREGTQPERREGES